MAAYRERLEAKGEVIKARQGNYQEMVMSPAMHKDFQINHMINQRSDQYIKDQEVKARAESQRRMAMSDDR